MKRKVPQTSPMMEEEEENRLVASDSMSVEEREEVVSTYIQRLRERDRREVIVKVMEELLENLMKALPQLKEANHVLDGKETSNSVGMIAECNLDSCGISRGYEREA